EGQGKFGGFRTVVLYERAALGFFVYGFAKNERANVSSHELEAFRHLASVVLAYGASEIERALAAGAFVEVHCDEKE
ncbi:MAG: type II toxin-antitoxin system RelE/ParE family toxin, partial [Candidatus Acidiferrales bacterium]